MPYDRLTEIELLEAANAAVADELKKTKKALEAANAAVEDQKALRAIDRSQQEARFRRFMLERVKLPLSDARDALHTLPMHVDVAVHRIELVLSAISAATLEAANAAVDES